MATYVIAANVNDNHLTSTANGYNNARSGTAITVQAVANANLTAGQRLVSNQYSCYEAFLQFDATVINPNAELTDLVMSVTGAYGYGDTGSANDEFVVKIRDWPSATVDTSFWVPGGSLFSYATWFRKPGVITGSTLSSYPRYDMAATFLSLNRTTVAGYMCVSTAQANGSSPQNATAYQIYSANNASTYVPALTVVTRDATPVKPIFLSSAQSRAAF